SLRFHSAAPPHALPSFPTRRSSDLHVLPRRLFFLDRAVRDVEHLHAPALGVLRELHRARDGQRRDRVDVSIPRLRIERRVREGRSEEHTSELQSLTNLVCRLLLENK